MVNDNNYFTTIFFVGFLLVVGGLSYNAGYKLGYQKGEDQTMTEMQEQLIEQGYARYHPQTGKFVFEKNTKINNDLEKFVDEFEKSVEIFERMFERFE